MWTGVGWVLELLFCLYLFGLRLFKVALFDDVDGITLCVLFVDGLALKEFRCFKISVKIWKFMLRPIRKIWYRLQKLNQPFSLLFMYLAKWVIVVFPWKIANITICFALDCCCPWFIVDQWLFSKTHALRQSCYLIDVFRSHFFNLMHNVFKFLSSSWWQQLFPFSYPCLWVFISR